MLFGVPLLAFLREGELFSAAKTLAQIGPVNLNFSIPMYNLSKLQARERITPQSVVTAFIKPATI